jgi:hypothetical protein
VLTKELASWLSSSESLESDLNLTTLSFTNYIMVLSNFADAKFTFEKRVSIEVKTIKVLPF